MSHILFFVSEKNYARLYLTIQKMYQNEKKKKLWETGNMR